VDKIYHKNPNIFTYQLNSMLYIVVNPMISDGMKVLNQIQKDVLDQINSKKTLTEIQKNLCLSNADMEKILIQLKKKDFVSETARFKSFFDNQSSPKSINVWVHTTNACNIACTYCYIHKDISHMHKDVYDKFYQKILQLVEERGLKKVTLRMAGGEPTTRLEYFTPFIDKLKKALEEKNCVLRIAFLTNLTIMNDEILAFIKKYRVSISTSLDGLKEFNDKNRIYANGNGSFDKVLKNMNILRDNNIPVFVNITIAQENMDGLLDLTKFLVERKLGFRYSFVNGIYIDKVKLASVLRKCYSYIEENLDKYPNFMKKHRLADLKFQNPVTQACGAGRTTFLLNTDGSIHYCPMVLSEKKPIGSLDNEQDLITQVSSQTKYNAFNTCFNCEYKHICAGGCPVEMQDGKSPFCDIFKEFIPVIYRLQAKQQILKSLGIEKYNKLFK